MDHKHNNRWGVTIVAAALLIMAAANLFSVAQIAGLRRELSASNDTLSSAIQGISGSVSGIQDDFQKSLDRAKEELRSSIEREESALAECKVEVGSYNSVANTVQITFQATPKEYRDGVSLFFMYTCDDQSSVTVTGERDDNGVFKKDVDIPLCEVMNLKVVISQGDTIRTETAEEALEVRKKVFLPLGGKGVL